MEKQKEALLRIVDSLQCKCDEITSFQSDLFADMRTLNEAYETSQMDVNSEFDCLFECLRQKKETMMSTISRELTCKQEAVKNQLKNCEESRSDADELIVVAQKALEINNSTNFNQVALSIKERITMSAIFRVSTSPPVTDTGCHLVANFKRVEGLLNKLDFLPVPQTPLLMLSQSVVINNNVTCEWTLPNQHIEKEDNDTALTPLVESFLFQYRQVNNDQATQDVPWKTIENIMEMTYTIKGMSFLKTHLQVRVQAWNKAVGGEFSKIMSLETPAFIFSLDPKASHGNLKVTTPHNVEWDPAATKPIEVRLRSASSVRSSPGKSTSPKNVKSKDRFIGESYTILGDTTITEDESYFEVTPCKDCKTFGVGIASQLLSRYDQLGRTSTSWCLFVNRWIQTSFVAKHNNKMKILDSCTIPSKIGVYFNNQLSLLSFCDAETHEILHTFKQIRSSSPLVAGFTVWCGSLQVHVGVQVPSWIEPQPSASPKQSSSAILSDDSDVSQDSKYECGV